MTLDDLRMFVAACEAGDAAHRGSRGLGTTQPAVSQRVRRLERECGLPLVERSRHGVAPTAAGHVLLAAATEALGALDAARRELHRGATVPAVRCGSPPAGPRSATS